MTEERHDRMILILDAATRAVVEQCAGPDIAGECPNAHGGVVPCAGRRVVPAYGTGIEGWRLTVVDTERRTCPLAEFLEE